MGCEYGATFLCRRKPYVFLVERERNKQPVSITGKGNLAHATAHCPVPVSSPDLPIRLELILKFGERLREVRAQILGGLDAARHPDQAIGYSQIRPIFRAHAAVRGGGRDV